MGWSPHENCRLLATAESESPVARRAESQRVLPALFESSQMAAAGIAKFLASFAVGRAAPAVELISHAVPTPDPLVQVP